MPYDIVVDVENTVQRIKEGNKKRIDGSPYNPLNKLVTIHWTIVDENGDRDDTQTAICFHNHFEGSETDKIEAFRELVRNARTFIAHQAKHDYQWLTESGFELPENVYCTLIGEYVLARGQRTELSLEDIANERNVARKKNDITHKLFYEDEIGYEDMPLSIVREYGEGDVVACYEIRRDQLKDYSEPVNAGLWPTVQMMNENLTFLAATEKNGIAIDLVALEEVENQFQAEKEELVRKLQTIAAEVLGDTPFNLNSNDDLSAIIYSRRPKDKKVHKEKFNLGLNDRGKPFPRPRMTPQEFSAAVRATCDVVYKTTASQCPMCKGKGKILKYKKNGEPFTKPNNCKVCDARGYLLTPTPEVAGLKLNPSGPNDAAVHGWATDKETLGKLIGQAKYKNNEKAVEFLQSIVRLNAVSVYLDSFCTGIRRWTRADGLLHTVFNQCQTATARLSSKDPNFQNQPRSGTFPIRKAVVSRWRDIGGEVLEADYSGLEFRVAGELSGDEQIFSDVLNKKDVHRQTASIIFKQPTSVITDGERQEAKPYTFAPLYGGQGASEPPHIQQYFKEFFNIYKGMAKKQVEWQDGVLATGIVRIPTGREYRWTNVKRYRNGRVSNATQIVNYPVQGFATGDIVPLACIRVRRKFKQMGLRSLHVLTVHDSIVIDVYPGERDRVVEALVWAMKGVHEELKTRYNYEMKMPLDIEIKAGPNWLKGTKLDLPEYKNENETDFAKAA